MVLQEMYKYRDTKVYPLLKHPLAQALIYREWNKAKYSILLTIHFVSYLLYVCLLAVYFLVISDDFIRSVVRTFLLSQCIFMLIALFPFQVLGINSKTEILYRITTKLCPHVLTFVALIMNYKPLSSFALIFSWLAITHFSNVIPFLSYKCALFQFITKKLLDHIVVFMYILTGFSVTFYLLYHEDEDSAFRTVWESVLSTTVMLMQGDLSGTPLFKSANETTIPHDVLVAGGIMQQLFVVIVVLALLNMWVGLAVRSGREMERQGHINYHRNQVGILLIMEGLFTMMFANNTSKSNRERNSVLVSEGDLPYELYSALKCSANQRNIQRVNLIEISQSLTRLSEKVDGIQKILNSLKQKGFRQFKE
ncbi:transient receptor potential cation channel subfamily A member 1 homolog isoform X1 [Anabrus simplex]|uniref:transient receptor potential cation channel subfamily A member 1 homolog isoform X1 n=1 Tax=Anabrus simplex TaxID=316456 RepID=UPI0035A2F7A2